jgi:hypothetical protein
VRSDILGTNERVLVVGQLSVQSSYAQNSESPADAARFDTVQWWLGPRRVWRIRTFAVDDDIHMHAVQGVPGAVLEVARASTRRNYADVLVRDAVIRIADYRDASAVSAQLRSELGMGELEVAEELELAFWNPTGARYQTKSQPR